MNEKNIKRVIYGLIVMLLFTPLIVIPNKFIFPFIVPKVITIRSLILVIAGLFVILIIHNRKKYTPKLTYTTLAIFVFLASATISSIVGVDWHRSFWDNHERMLGLFTVTHYIILYLVATTLITTKEEWLRLWRIFLGAGAIVILLAIMQKIDPEFLINRGSERVSSTLGNAIYLGGYGMFLSLLGWFVLVKEKTLQWKLYAASMSLLGVIGLLISGTRGAVLGLAAGIGVLLLGYLITLKDRKKIRLSIIAVLLFGVTSLGILYTFRTTSFVMRIPTVGHLLNTNISSGTANTRVVAWQIAVESWKEKPIFGWGPNNYYYAFNKYYRPESLEHGYGETWFDNAHSVFFNTLSVQGIIGLMAYLGLYLVPIIILIVRYRQKKIDPHVCTVGAAILIAHFAQTFFVFENPTSYIYLFLWLGFINQQTLSKDSKIIDTKNKKVAILPAAVVLFIAFGLVYITNINPGKANHRSLQALLAVQKGESPVEVYKKAINTPTPHKNDIRQDFARLVVSASPLYQKANRQQDLLELIELSYSEVGKNIDVHPADIRSMLQMSQVAQQGFAVSKNAKFLIEGEYITKQAVPFSPKRQQTYYVLSGFQYQLQKHEDAIKTLKTTIEHHNKIGEGWWRLAVVYRTIGDIDSAIETIEKAREANASFSVEGEKIAKSIEDLKENTIEKTDTTGESDQS